MPGRSYDGSPPALSADETALRDRLRAHVATLAGEIGERNAQDFAALERARAYIAKQFALAGYDPSALAYAHDGQTFANVEVVLVGEEDRAIVVGAHYDSAIGSPGANDNASGVAVVIELARVLRDSRFKRAIRFVAFANEEPPYFNTGEGMGSVEYVRAFVDPRSAIAAMLSIETVGYYSDEPGSQHYPSLVASLYPDRGNFIGFIGNVSSKGLVEDAVRTFRTAATLPSEGAVLPESISGVGWSDHRSFWAAGVPALMVTDTAPFRYPHYHRDTDTPERLDYERMARLVTGLVQVLSHLAGTD